MNSPIHFRIFLCVALVTVLSPVSHAAADTCMGFTCTIVGSGGNDVLTGTPGPDVICGGGGNDTISGGGGSDKICGGPGADTLFGDSGTDLLQGDAGNDSLNGGGDSDTAVFESAVTADLTAGSSYDGSTDTLALIENLSGSNGADILIGDSGNNRLIGQGGNDTLTGRGGSDMLDGKSGTDTATYDTAITASLTTGSASDGDMLIGIENLQGSNGNDVLEGDGNNNVLIAGLGIDYLDGKGGTDTCDGGPPFPSFQRDDPDICTTACETASGCTVQ